MKLLLLSFCAFLVTFGAVKAQVNVVGALKMGDKAPDFTLKNASGKEVQLYELIKEGPVVLTWYRGSWCPYCNKALTQLQEALPRLKEQHATLVALTAEVPDSTLSTIEKDQLDFEVLSDIDLKVASSYGVAFKLNNVTAKLYEVGFGLSNYNGNKRAELPYPATYIIDPKGVIIYAFVDDNYKKRANPDDLIEVLKKR